jgi:hypothetical protein
MDVIDHKRPLNKILYFLIGILASFIFCCILGSGMSTISRIFGEYDERSIILDISGFLVLLLAASILAAKGYIEHPNVLIVIGMLFLFFVPIGG